jgi:hypothetical protein
MTQVNNIIGVSGSRKSCCIAARTPPTSTIAPTVRRAAPAMRLGSATGSFRTLDGSNVPAHPSQVTGPSSKNSGNARPQYGHSSLPTVIAPVETAGFSDARALLLVTINPSPRAQQTNPAPCCPSGPPGVNRWRPGRDQQITPTLIPVNLLTERSRSASMSPPSPTDRSGHNELSQNNAEMPRGATIIRYGRLRRLHDLVRLRASVAFLGYRCKLT